MNNVFKNFRTTILGLILLGFTGYSIITGIILNNIILGGLIVSGILLVIAPDTYAELLEKAILNFVKKDKEKDDELPPPDNLLAK